MLRCAVLDDRQRALAERIGVTRVARVTGLDRSGVEVACAVRPGGHVLQVSNGKGDSFAAAAWSALGEAAELWAAERVDEAELAWGTHADLERSCAAWGPGELGGGASGLVDSLGFLDSLRLAWVRGAELFSGEAVALLAQAVHCPPPGSVSLGPVVLRWTSNGMGAHPDREQALVHALLEAIERDQLARALPDGITARELQKRLIDVGDDRERLLPRTSALLARLDRAGFQAHLIDVAPRGRGHLGLPVAGALLLDREQGPVPLSAGYACRLGLDEAFHAALLEAVQSRVTDVHGARDDIAPMDPDEVGEMRDAIARVRSRRGVAAIGGGGKKSRAGAAEEPTGGALATILARLSLAGIERAAVVELGPPGIGLHIIKVVIPGFLVSGLL